MPTYLNSHFAGRLAPTKRIVHRLLVQQQKTRKDSMKKIRYLIHVHLLDKTDQKTCQIKLGINNRIEAEIQNVFEETPKSQWKKPAPF